MRLLLNLIWLVFGGLVMALGLGLANFKLIPVSLTPFGREVVDLEQARRLGYAADVAMPADPSGR